MHLPKAKGYTYLVQARCSLSSYAEYEALRSENGKNVANFIFKSIVCRWGTPIDLITDNGTAYITTAKILSDQGASYAYCPTTSERTVLWSGDIAMFEKH